MVKLLSKHWQAVIQSEVAARGWTYAPVPDLARLLRLPGSINRKAGSERRCRVVEQTGAVYPVQGLQQIA